MKYIGIFSENRKEWYMAQLAAMSDSITIVPIAVELQFLETERVVDIIKKTGLTTLCVSQKTIQIILDLKIKNLIPNVENIITFDPAQDTHKILSAQVGINIFQFNALVHQGKKMGIVQKDEPLFNTIFYLGITSGTTGEPKIAMLSHLNFISGQVAAGYLGYNFTEHDVYLSYVPLTHVFEQICFADAVIWGFRIGFSTGDNKNLIEDIQYLRPTFMGSFPLFFNKVYEKIEEKVNTMPSLAQWMIHAAIDAKLYNWTNYGIVTHYFYDLFLFRSFRNILGGRLRIMVSGGAPLQPKVKSALTILFSAPILEAYGMTEVAGCISCTSRWERKGGNVGGILSCVRMHLKEINQVDTIVDAQQPIGELYLKGNSVMHGYYKDPERTKEVLDQDGWLKVGDVVKILNNGALEIVERVAEFKKLQSGQYISPLKLENVYIHAPMVSQICVDINPGSEFLVAIVVLDKDQLMLNAVNSGLETMSIEMLMRSEEIENAVLAQLAQLCKARNLGQSEKIQRIVVSMEPFTFQNGMLTNSHKIRRDVIRQRFASTLDMMYERQIPKIESQGLIKDPALNIN